MGFFDQDYLLNELINYFDFLHVHREPNKEEGEASFWCVYDQACSIFENFTLDPLDSVTCLVKSNMA